MKRGRPFGEKKKEKDLVRKGLARVRATAMEGSFGGRLTRKLAVNAELLWGNYILVMKNRQKNRSKRSEIDIKLKF